MHLQPWAPTLRVEALGDIYLLDLTSLSEHSARTVRKVWRGAATRKEGVPAATVAADGALPMAEMLSDLSQRVTLAAIDGARGKSWTVHAAGLAAADGRVVVLLGASGSGKTTASLALGHTLAYVTDETVTVDPNGSIHPYRKPLSIIENGVAYPKAQRSPSVLGLAGLPHAPLRLGAIVLLTRQPDGPLEPRVDEIDLADALPELVSQTSHLAELPHPLQTLAAHVAAAGGVHRVTYRESDTLLAVIQRILSRSSTALADHGVPPLAPSTEPVLSQARKSAQHRPAAARERFYRTPAVDCVQLANPDRLVMLHLDSSGRGTVRLLTGLGPQLWLSANGATVNELADVVVNTYGNPGLDVQAAVITAVTDMSEQGLLTSSAHPVPSTATG